MTVELTVRSVGTNPAGFEELYSGRTWHEDGGMFIRFPEAASKFRRAGTSDVLKRFIGKTIRVTGRVESVRLPTGVHPVIVVNDVDQVELVEAGAKEADAKDKPTLVIDAGGHTARVYRIQFTPDGKGLISVSADKSVRVWDLESGATTRVLRPPAGFRRGEGELLALAISPVKRIVAIGGSGSKTRENGYPFYLADLTNGRMSRVFLGHTSSVVALAFGPGGQRLASSSLDARRGSGTRAIGV